MAALLTPHQLPWLPYACSLSHPGEEYEEKQRLDEQLRAAMDKYKYKRRQIREFQDDLQTMSNTMENLTRDERAYEDMVEEKQVCTLPFLHLPPPPSISGMSDYALCAYVHLS